LEFRIFRFIWNSKDYPKSTKSCSFLYRKSSSPTLGQKIHFCVLINLIKFCNKNTSWIIQLKCFIFFVPWFLFLKVLSTTKKYILHSHVFISCSKRILNLRNLWCISKSEVLTKLSWNRFSIRIENFVSSPT
jgi:hypothetical protein